jgi:hypothetical protein
VGQLLDREAAIQATAWGPFQLQGFEFQTAKYGSSETFMSDAHESDRTQLKQLIEFVNNKKYNGKTCLEYLRGDDFDNFAKCYNGPKALEPDDSGQNYSDRYKKHLDDENAKSQAKAMMRQATEKLTRINRAS